MNQISQRNGGIFKIIILVIIGIIILTVFNIDLRSFFTSDLWQSNWGVVKEFSLKIFSWLVIIWNKYLADSASYIQEKFLEPVFSKLILTWTD